MRHLNGMVEQMATSPSHERVLLLVLLGLTTVTGVIDAVSYLALGHVFTANMTGNVVFLSGKARFRAVLLTRLPRS